MFQLPGGMVITVFFESSARRIQNSNHHKMSNTAIPITLDHSNSHLFCFATTSIFIILERVITKQSKLLYCIELYLIISPFLSIQTASRDHIHTVAKLVSFSLSIIIRRRTKNGRRKKNRMNAPNKTEYCA